MSDPIVLEAATKIIDDSLVEKTVGAFRVLARGAQYVAVEGGGDAELWIPWLLAVRRAFPQRASIAHVGGGFCVLAHILGPNYTHTVFEAEPLFDRYCPTYSTFVPGDWTLTITGNFDVILYDIGGPAPPLALSHLNPGGLVLDRP